MSNGNIFDLSLVLNFRPLFFFQDGNWEIKHRLVVLGSNAHSSLVTLISNDSVRLFWGFKF
jgi:hypothetical protein